MAANPPLRGLLAVNLGSPAAPTAPAVRRYLRQFLSDRRVVDVPRIIWWPILHLFILPFRSPRSAALYRRVWTPGGAPLIVRSRALADRLAERLEGEARVALAMRYGEPSIRAGLRELLDAGCNEIVLLPLFPQYAEATVGSVRAAVHDELARLAPRVSLRHVEPFPEDPAYLRALAARCRETAADGPPPSHWVWSFHGLPVRQVQRGDPYRVQCEATARALSRELGLAAQDWSLVFQSRFGPQEWLQPYAAEAVPALAARCPDLVIACPGFAADCLETTDEIGELLRESFLAAGGRSFRLVPCLNDDPAFADALAALARAAWAPPQPPSAAPSP